MINKNQKGRLTLGWLSLLVVIALSAHGDDTEALSFPPQGVHIQQAPIYTAPVPVIDITRTTHSGDLLFALFQPGRQPLWRGNIKRYRLGPGTGTDEQLILYDAHGEPALDADTGLFVPETTSLWTPAAVAPDGASIARGGLASRSYDFQAGTPIASSRNVFTFTGTFSELDHPSNAVHEANISDGSSSTKALTKPLFDAADLSDATFVELVRWARGVDVADLDADGDREEGRLAMGAPLHSQPAVVGLKTPDGTQQNIVFVTTNAGYLHAAVMDTNDEDESLEQFAFIPPDRLPNLRVLKANQTGTGDASSGHTLRYGLDGGITTWFHDQLGDGVLDIPEDHLYVYFGQRRGGRYYYALDVTDLTSPKLLWVVRGGSGDFSELGQSWSSPMYARIALQLPEDDSPRARDVVLFGGGFDPLHDQPGQPRRGDGMGRAIYIVDAKTGDMLWWAGPSGHPDGPDLALADMRYAVPAPITAVDRDGDRLIDLFTVADLGGQLWRFDVIAGAIHGGVIADLQDHGDGYVDVASNRRFFEAVDVAVSEAPGLGDHLAFAVASGYRAHPLNPATHEAVFVLRQSDPFGPPPAPISYKKLDAGDLLDITEQPDLNTSELTQEEIDLYKNGWQLYLRESATHEFVGEKVLAAPLIASGLLLFTSYTPDPQPGPYGPGPGRSRFYAIRLSDGTPTQALKSPGSETGQLKVDDRFEDLPSNGLPTAPVVVFPPFDTLEPVVLVGTHRTGLTLSGTMRRSFWYQDHVH